MLSIFNTQMYEMVSVGQTLLELTVGLVSVLIFLFALDDLFIDLVANLRGIRPTRLGTDDLRQLQSLYQRRIAILIANWHEDEIIERMVEGNLAQIKYQNYAIFLGVYPNDPATYKAACRLRDAHKNVHVIVNSQVGPTSKGQLLNVMAKKILESESHTGDQYEIFLLQDSEDIIHPLSLQLMNSATLRSDFVQIPVFSLPTPHKNLVAGTYLEEFAEAHTKTLLVRHFLGAPVPSAGVGTALTRRLMLALIDSGNGYFLTEGSLTEDYLLGHESARRGFSTSFQCKYFINQQRKKEFIATREFFPHNLKDSVRQKTRWNIGIVYQGAEYLGWKCKGWAGCYFLWRDRRGAPNAILTLAATVILIGFTTYYLIEGSFPAFVLLPWFLVISTLNLVSALWRMACRAYAVNLVHGFVDAMLTVPRWPVGNLIYFWTVFRADRQYKKAVKEGTRIAWVKTSHRLPSRFGERPLPETPRAAL